jgi:hypothetical protein
MTKGGDRANDPVHLPLSPLELNEETLNGQVQRDYGETNTKRVEETTMHWVTAFMSTNISLASQTHFVLSLESLK